MILKDRVTLRAEVDTGEWDAHGRPIYSVEDLGTYPAHVGSASGSSPTVGNGEMNLTELRAIVPGVVPIDQHDVSSTVVVWRGLEYRVQAHLPFSRGGRVHHWTLTLERIT